MIFKTTNFWSLALILCTVLVTAQAQQPCNLVEVRLRPGEMSCQNMCPPTTPSRQCTSYVIGVIRLVCPPGCCISRRSCLIELIT